MFIKVLVVRSFLQIDDILCCEKGKFFETTKGLLQSSFCVLRLIVIAGRKVYPSLPPKIQGIFAFCTFPKPSSPFVWKHCFHIRPHIPSVIKESCITPPEQRFPVQHFSIPSLIYAQHRLRLRV